MSFGADFVQQNTGLDFQIVVKQVLSEQLLSFLEKVLVAVASKSSELLR